MRLRVALALILATHPTHVLAQAAVVEETAKALGGRVANDAPIMVVVVFFTLALTLFAAWGAWRIHSKAMAEKDARYDEAVKRHEEARASFAERYASSADRQATSTQALAVTLEKVHLAMSEDRADSAELRGELRTAITDNKLTLAEIRTAVLDRDANRSRGAGR